MGRGGDAKVSSLRVKNAILHDLTVDDIEGNVPPLLPFPFILEISYELLTEKMLLSFGIGFHEVN